MSSDGSGNSGTRRPGEILGKIGLGGLRKLQPRKKNTEGRGWTSLWKNIKSINAVGERPLTDAEISDRYNHNSYLTPFARQSLAELDAANQAGNRLKLLEDGPKFKNDDNFTPSSPEQAFGA